MTTPNKATDLPPPTYQESQTHEQRVSTTAAPADAAAAQPNSINISHASPPSPNPAIPNTEGRQNGHHHNHHPTTTQPAPHAPMNTSEKVTPIHLLTETIHWIDCPFCKTRTQTRYETHGQGMQILVGGLLFLCCICLAPLPCCLHWFEETDWFCRTCNKKVATRTQGDAVRAVGIPNANLVQSQYVAPASTANPSTTGEPRVEASSVPVHEAPVSAVSPSPNTELPATNTAPIELPSPDQQPNTNNNVVSPSTPLDQTLLNNTTQNESTPVAANIIITPPSATTSSPPDTQPSLQPDAAPIAPPAAAVTVDHQIIAELPATEPSHIDPPPTESASTATPNANMTEKKQQRPASPSEKR